jgi:hypothetical protein
LNVTHDIIQLLEENLGEHFIGAGNDIFGEGTKSTGTRRKCGAICKSEGSA